MPALGLSLGLPFGGAYSAPFVGPLDGQTSNIAGAWSISRRLLSSYTGPLIRIRRSSDNTEMDVGYGGDNELSQAAVAAFVSGNSAFVTVMYDQSGAGYHAGQSAAATQPQIVNSGTINTLSGKPTMTLSGSNWLDIATLQTTGVRSYTCAIKSTGATWNDYGSPLGNTVNSVATWLGVVDSGSTSFYSNGTSLPLAVRRNGISLLPDFDCSPINVPMILGLDCHLATEDSPSVIGQTSRSWALAASISELVSWGTITDRTFFEANQKTFFGI